MIPNGLKPRRVSILSSSTVETARGKRNKKE